jgi:hypothetical protein
MPDGVLAKRDDIECLLGSTVPQHLRDAGYNLKPAGEGQRILPAAITRWS